MIEDYHKVHAKRRRLLAVSPDWICKMFTPGLFMECVDGLPEKTEMVGASFDPGRNMFYICLENNEWEPVDVGQMIPEMALKFKSYWGKELQVMRKIIKDVKADGQKEN